MKTKASTITLIVDKYSIKQEFSIKHAERLLDMGPDASGGWTLPKNSEFTYSKEDGLRRKPDKGNTAKTKQA